jgi:hypothetical protein
MTNLGSAKHIKASFIDVLLERKNEVGIIGSEIMFADKKALADLILLSNNKIIAYEIKAQNDDFRKILYQLEAYNNVFDYVNLITTEKHLKKAKQQMPEKTALL